MLKYKYHAVIYFGDLFDKNALFITLKSIAEQTGKIARSIFTTVIVPEAYKNSGIEEMTQNRKFFDFIYCNDCKEELRRCLIGRISEYVTVVRAGSVFSGNALDAAYDCFETVKGNCDVVGIRIETEEKLYNKYNSSFSDCGGKIFHLTEKYNFHPIGLDGLFIKSHLAAQKASCAEKGFEETSFLADILSRRNVFAAADSTSYIVPNITDTAAVSPDIFEKTLDEINAIIARRASANRIVPYYLQSLFLHEILKCLNNAAETVNAYHIIHYDFNAMWDKLGLLLKSIDDKVIMEFSTTRFNKLFLLHQKYGKYCWIDLYYNDLRMMYGNTSTYNLSSFPVRFDLVEIKKGNLSIEGVCHVPSSINLDSYSIKALINGKLVGVEPVERYSDRYFYDKVYLCEAGFKLEIPLTDSSFEIRLVDSVEENICVKSVYEFSNICRLGNDVAEDYYYSDGYAVNYSDNAIICRRCSNKERRYWEETLQFAIRCDIPSRADEIIEIRNYYWNSFQKKTKQIWLITDRPDRADDNGEAFFRYMTERAEEDIELYFVLSRESASYLELSKIGKIIEPFSTEHKKLHLIADYLISSQMAEAVYNPFNEDVKYFRGLFRNPRQVFLQHGVINNEHGGRFFSRYGRDFCGFVVSADEEYNYMREPKFHYTEHEVWLTGLPRWDRLYRDDKKKITIMPTWRKYLTTRTFDEEAGTKIWKVNDNFTDTEYFKFYNSVINSEKLLDAADKYGYTICFMPHVIFLKETDKFDKNQRTVIYDYEKSYREIYAESSLVVTDFSSAVFDFAFMRQPIVYCQFDKEEFYAGHSYSKGYFDHERDGFGEVTYDVDGLVKVLTEYMAEGCVLKPKYRKRIDEFFSFADKKCCERVYEKIREDQRYKE